MNTFIYIYINGKSIHAFKVTATLWFNVLKLEQIQRQTNNNTFAIFPTLSLIYRMLDECTAVLQSNDLLWTTLGSLDEGWYTNVIQNSNNNYYNDDELIVLYFTEFSYSYCIPSTQNPSKFLLSVFNTFAFFRLYLLRDKGPQNKACEINVTVSWSSRGLFCL